jgi:class 3 adenylate cyclase
VVLGGRHNARVELPTGTVTMLFSDVEGSTRLLAALGDQYGEVLSAQRRLLREAFSRHQGIELGTEGDSFFLAFASALDAATACADGQRALAAHAWPRDMPPQVRMGLHTGEPGMAAAPRMRLPTRSRTSERLADQRPGPEFRRGG